MKPYIGLYRPGEHGETHMALKLHKDLRLAMEAAQDQLLPLPGMAIAQQLFRAVEALEGRNDGTKAIVKALERLGNVHLGTAAS